MRAEGEPASHHGVTVTPGENGWFEVAAEWDPENIAKVHGEAAARELAASWRAEGSPAAPVTDPVTVDEGAIGTEAEGLFVVGAPWIADDDRELFQTREAADERAAALREAGPPEGWSPPTE